VIFMVKVESFEEFSESLIVVLAVLIFIFKSVNFVVNNKKIDLLYKSLKALIEEDTLKSNQNGSKLKQRTKQVDRIFKLLMCFSMFCVTMSVFVAFCAHELPLKMWFPWDYEANEGLFWILATYQIIGGFIITPSSILVDFFPLFILSYLTGTLEELSENLEMICGAKTIKEIKTPTCCSYKPDKTSLKIVELLEAIEKLEKLVECVKIHQKVVKIAVEFNEIFAKDFWFEGIIAVIILCTTSFSLTFVSDSIWNDNL
jgi:hypothetical protein